MKNDRYYYSVMPDEEKKAYQIIYDGIRQRLPHIEIPGGLSGEQLRQVYIKTLYDNPLMFYVNQTVINMRFGAGRCVLTPEYIYTAHEIASLMHDMHNIALKLREKADAFRDNPFRLEKFLHDSIVKSVAYDYDALDKTDCFNAHSVIGAFLDKKAVCEGIAKAFKLLCNEFGIKCIVVYGKTGQHGDFSGDTYHAWNLVKIGGESYHVDVTWDNKYHDEPPHISYDYFNMTTEDILKDHRPAGYALPFCDSTSLNYFYSTGSIVNGYSQLVGLVKSRLSSKRIMFKASADKGEFLTFDEFQQKTCDAVRQALAESGEARAFTVCFNETHKIARVFF